jgi:hypothetical protein
MSLDNEILKHFGGYKNNDLFQLLFDETDYEQVKSIKCSSYCSHDDILNLINLNSQGFSVLSLNCQSINAKFSKLQILLKELYNHNFEYSAICLQESWLSAKADISLLQLDNYQCIHKGKSASLHGGLIIYLHNR